MEELKKCSCCQKEFPKTKDYFKQYQRNGKICLTARCKNCLREYDRKYRVENREKFRNINKKFDRSAKGVYKKLKQDAKTHGHKVTISQEKFVEWYESQPRKCCYCGIAEEDIPKAGTAFNTRVTRLTIDRVNSSKEYEEGNLALCCLRCNLTKSNFFTQSEMEEIGQKYIARRWKDALRN